MQTKTRTCQRCQGTGYRSTPVQHLGIPGLCYGCDGSKKQQWTEVATITAEREAAHARHIKEVEQALADIAAGFAQGTIRERNRAQWTAEKSDLLARLKAAGIEVVKKGEWRPWKNA